MTEHWLLQTSHATIRDGWSGRRGDFWWEVYKSHGHWYAGAFHRDTGQERASDEATTANEAAEALCKAMGWTEPGGEPSPPKTVRVRIAVHRWRTASGEWRALALGSSHEGDLYARRRGAQLARACDPDPADRGHIVWVEADVPIPTEVVVRAEVGRE